MGQKPTLLVIDLELYVAGIVNGTVVAITVRKSQRMRRLETICMLV